VKAKKSGKWQKIQKNLQESINHIIEECAFTENDSEKMISAKKEAILVINKAMTKLDKNKNF